MTSVEVVGAAPVHVATVAVPDLLEGALHLLVVAALATQVRVAVAADTSVVEAARPPLGVRPSIVEVPMDGDHRQRQVTRSGGP